jgi:Zn-dependent peptidase ImmA (M78 family)
LDALNPTVLADHLGIPLLPLTALRAAVPEEVDHFCSVESGAFSAVTIFDGPSRLIVFNDSHPDTRLANSIAHELAHGLLFHPAQPALDATGCRVWDTMIENEADFLAGALLVTDIAAVNIVRRSLPLDQAALKYGVSTKLITYRINVTGARRRAGLARGQR